MKTTWKHRAIGTYVVHRSRAIARTAHGARPKEDIYAWDYFQARQRQHTVYSTRRAHTTSSNFKNALKESKYIVLYPWTSSPIQDGNSGFRIYILLRCCWNRTSCLNSHHYGARQTSPLRFSRRRPILNRLDFPHQV